MNNFPTTILLATDGSEEAEMAAGAAAGLSSSTGARLHIVYVLAPIDWDVYAPVPDDYFEYYEQSGWRMLEGEAKRTRDAGGSIDETHLGKGAAVDQILQLAEEIEAGMIVMGSRGRGPVTRLLMGSVSEGVVHHARCPVLVLRGGDSAWPPTQIVVGDDGSEQARAAGELAAGIGGALGAKGLLMRCFPEPPEIDPEGRVSNPRIVDDALRREERDLMNRAGELEEIWEERPRVRVAVGDPAALILEAVREREGASLAVVGSRGLGKMERMRLGSVSTKVLRAAEGPVLICPYSTP